LALGGPAICGKFIRLRRLQSGCGVVILPKSGPHSLDARVVLLHGAAGRTAEDAPMSSPAPSPPPEQGQLVNVRSRQWVVQDVRASTLPPPALKPTFHGPQHLLTLSSVEDDGLGEELRVIWEIEPGAKLIEKVALPEPTDFDPPDKLDAFLDAVRWGAASTADVKKIQAPCRSGIDTEDHQLDPVVSAIRMPRVNLLVADNPPLGKPRGGANQ
jgi:hypothetical protein